MDETCVNDGYSGIIEWMEVYDGPRSPQGFELFIKYEYMELHLETLVSDVK